MFKRPVWWDKPITWGASVKMSLWSCLISLVVFLIEGVFFGWFDDTIDAAKDFGCMTCTKASDLREALGDKWDEIFHKEET